MWFLAEINMLAQISGVQPAVGVLLSAETNLEDSAAVFLGDSEVPNTNLVNPELIRR
jgi:hypothetical protein